MLKLCQCNSVFHSTHINHVSHWYVHPITHYKNMHLFKCYREKTLLTYLLTWIREYWHLRPLGHHGWFLCMSLSFYFFFSLSHSCKFKLWLSICSFVPMNVYMCLCVCSGGKIIETEINGGHINYLSRQGSSRTV